MQRCNRCGNSALRYARWPATRMSEATEGDGSDSNANLVISVFDY